MIRVMPLKKHHETHRETILKFIGLVGILLTYFGYMSWQYGAAVGAKSALLTWSFFVLCTPVADGGFLLAFPIRLLFGLRMLYTQILIWFLAIGINALMILLDPKAYELVFITTLLKKILLEPFPYWGILAISLLGTLLSIYFGDEMIDVTSHKHRIKHHKHSFVYQTILVLAFGALTFVAYYHLLSSLGISVTNII